MEAIEKYFEKHVDNTQIWYVEAIQEVTNFQEQLTENWENLMLEKSDAEKA